MKALIIGAGVAGPVAAMALARVGVDSEVFERDGQDAAQRGAWLTLQANGLDALQAIDAAGPLTGVGYPVETIAFVNGKGRALGRMPLAARRPDGLTSLMMPRATLYSALAQEARSRGVTVRHGAELTTATVDDDGVTAHFADGTTARGDFLIGADGIHSPVRTLIDPAAAAPRYVPVLNLGGYIPDFTVDVPPREFRMQFGTRCFFAWMPTPDGGTVWFANPPEPTEPARGVLSGVDDAQWRRRLHALMDGDAGPAAAIIDAAPGPLTGWATYDLPVVNRWHDGRGRMVLIGDAAHATSPAAGQGAAMALEDAVILAQCVRDRPTTGEAFTAFEALRRARTERIVAEGRRASNSKAAGPVGRVVRDLVLPLVFRRAARDDGRSLTWLQGHHIDFAVPV
ncbi:FAD-dependent monooxygenase [Tsukamurella asaccharolytica]|uniref:FAD-dependent monooxygenase n=1 Tax=Tsukamurella asaccharolytica TaxID=2592067 RepID=A0A5C5RER5_9ACTN|nr:NAD(P)/FAD-dependent oxidoreductase [Tsukamurella asaccharolytica]TWS20581.1 FAD-dependent monooxygenase [Tsukamurella asaccharolytica]